MSKVFYHWGLEERLLEFAIKSNMTLFTRCEWLFLTSFTSIRNPPWPFWGFASAQSPTFADRSLTLCCSLSRTVESGEDLGGHVWIDELMRETGGEFLFAKVSFRTSLAYPILLF
jgi:hypothetical protein